MDIFDSLAVSGPTRELALDFSRGIRPGVPFPESYIALLARFGYGLLCERFLVYPPLDDYPDSFYVRSAGLRWALDETLHLDDPGYDFLLEPDGSRELLPHLVAFAMGENGESLFWDIRDSGAKEYPVYITGRGMGIHYAGHDLRDFIARVTAAETVRSVMKFKGDALPRSFRTRPNPTFEAWLAQRAAKLPPA